MNKVIGILGGMGPLATVDLFKKIVETTPTTVEQEHLRIIIDNNPKIPSRIEAILKGNCDPLPEMIKSARILEDAGADFILIPCHTAHYWLNQLQQNVEIPIISIIECTAASLKERSPQPDKILLLATEATIRTKLYKDVFRAAGLDIRLPHSKHQKTVSQAIQEVKAGHIQSNPWLKPLDIMMDYYMTGGVTAALGGCTEIPLLYPFLNSKIEKLDPTMMLAKQAVILAKPD